MIFDEILYGYWVTISGGTVTNGDDRNAPMFRSRGVKGRGVGLARGRATVSRARASGRGAGPR